MSNGPFINLRMLLRRGKALMLRIVPVAVRGDGSMAAGTMTAEDFPPAFNLAGRACAPSRSSRLIHKATVQA